MIIKFEEFINENIFNWNKKKTETKYPPSFIYDCKKVSERDLLFEYKIKFDNKEFDYEEKKLISLFLGDHVPMTKKHLYEFIYKINKNVGFGLSISSRKTIKAEVSKQTGIDKLYYLLELTYPTKTEFFLCGNLKSCFKKIKEIEKSDEKIESRDEIINVNVL